MENWIQEVISKWKLEGIKLNPPATITELETTEAVLNFKFPADFKGFYLAANGFKDWDMQEHNFSFWPLNRILEEHNAAGNKSFIGFSDWLIRCNAIGFMKESSGIYKDHVIDIGSGANQSGVIVTSKDAYGKSREYLNVIDKIADTFEEIVLMINTGTGDIY